MLQELSKSFNKHNLMIKLLCYILYHLKEAKDKQKNVRRKRASNRNISVPMINFNWNWRSKLTQYL